MISPGSRRYESTASVESLWELLPPNKFGISGQTPAQRAFGRSRANFDNSSLQITINTADIDDKPRTFVIRANFDGIFPTALGDSVDVFATDGKSKSGTHWILDFVGTLSVDDPVPITVFEDVEEISEINDIVEESIEDCYNLTLSDFYTDADLEGLSDEDLAELEVDLITEICTEVSDEVEDDISGDSA